LAIILKIQQADKLRGREIEKKTDRQTGNHVDVQKVRPSDRQADRQIDR
jgi:hypothetical protein